MELTEVTLPELVQLVEDCNEVYRTFIHKVTYASIMVRVVNFPEI